MKLEAPETRAMVRFLDEWNPHLTIDTHTTNGSYHRYTITYDGPKNPAGDRRLIAFSREKFFPEVGASFAKANRVSGRSFYGNFESDHTRWTSFPADPSVRHDLYRPPQPTLGAFRGIFLHVL